MDELQRFPRAYCAPLDAVLGNHAPTVWYRGEKLKGLHQTAVQLP